MYFQFAINSKVIIKSFCFWTYLQDNVFLISFFYLNFYCCSYIFLSMYLIYFFY